MNLIQRIAAVTVVGGAAIFSANPAFAQAVCPSGTANAGKPVTCTGPRSGPNATCTAADIASSCGGTVTTPDPRAKAKADARARADARAKAAATSTSGATATNGDQSQSVNIRTTVAPGMALSSGDCMAGLSASLGLNAFAGGVSGAFYSETCGRWKAIGYGAANMNCLVAMTSVAIAADGRPLSPIVMQQAGAYAINMCGALPRPRQ